MTLELLDRDWDDTDEQFVNSSEPISTVKARPPHAVATNKLERYLTRTRFHSHTHDLMDLVDLIDRGQA